MDTKGRKHKQQKQQHQKQHQKHMPQAWGERITNKLPEFYNNYYDVKQTNYLKGEWAWNEFSEKSIKKTIAEV